MAEETRVPGARSGVFSAWLTSLPILSPVVDWWASVLFARSKVEFHGVFPDRDTALRSIPRRDTPVGYDNDQAAGYYREFLDRVAANDYAVMFWLRQILQSGRLFEVGGHVGVAYYAYQRYLTHPTGLEWQINDTAAVCEAGRLLAEQRNARSLSFTTDLSRGDGADIFLSIGALQYLDVSLPDILGSYVARPPHVLINMTPVADRGPYFTLQNIGVSVCPCRIESRDALLAGMAGLHYELIDSWKNPGKFCRIAFRPRDSLDHYEGYYFRLAAAPGK